MGTKDFNLIDLFIARIRMSKVAGFVKNGDNILDFGCGNQSLLLETMNNKLKSGIGVDYDTENRKKGNVEYVRFKFLNKLPFKNDFFDKVFLLAVLEHIDPNNVKILFNEFYRILKPKGIIILTTPTPHSKKILEFLAYKLHLISETEVRDHKMYYDRKKIEDLIPNLQIINYELFGFGLNSLCVIKKN